VISEKNIISNENGKVTFSYVNSTTKKTEYRILDGEDFLYLVLKHVLPRGFRRVRDYGFCKLSQEGQCKENTGTCSACVTGEANPHSKKKTGRFYLSNMPVDNEN